MDRPGTYTAFSGHQCIAVGDAANIVQTLATYPADARPPLILENITGTPVELAMLSSRPDPITKPRRGRPRLGVAAREVTLLPRHWAWLATQPGGASAALRRLVEVARRDESGADGARLRREAIHRAMTQLAGDLPGYEAALRALYASDRRAVIQIVDNWPTDIALFLKHMMSDTPA